MKRILITAFTTLATLCACNNNQSSNPEKNRQNHKTTDKANRIRIPLRITGDFFQITNAGSIDVVYQQGSYKVEAEGDSALLQYIDTEVEGGVLTLNLKRERNAEINAYEGKSNITAYISCPDLRYVALCSSGSFTSIGKWESDKMQLGIIGNGNFILDSISCTSLDYQATGIGTATFKNIDAKEQIIFTTMSKGDITADVNTNTLIAASQAGRITLTGTASKKDISATDSKLIKDNTTTK